MRRGTDGGEGPEAKVERGVGRRLTVVPGEGAGLAIPRRERPLEPVRVLGRGFRAGSERFVVRGITYGTFRPNGAGDLFPTPEQVAHDFAAMVAAGINCVRVY